MPLTVEAKDAIQAEERVLEAVVESLKQQRVQKLERMDNEGRRARELTSQLVATHRDEEKWLLASDEAVSHGIKDKQKIDISVIDRLLKDPYFARMIVVEEMNGEEKEIEYKIGLAENSECRIIDWRKAPIAKLYYEYKEGDDYSEQIQGREREGMIALRNVVETKSGILSRLTCRYGTFMKRGGEWNASDAQLHPHSVEGDEQEPAVNQNLLPQIASFLSPEQFSLIAENPERAILIQGVAGSGKTTVALHRLAWLFAMPEHAPAPDRVIALVLSHSLQTYISQTLPSLGVEGVRVLTLVDWFTQILQRAAPRLVVQGEYDAKPRIKRPSDPLPQGIDRLKRSMAMLRAVEDFIAKNKANLSRGELSPESILVAALKNSRPIIDQDETRLINEDLVRSALERTLRNQAEGVIDRCDDALIVRIICLLNGGVPLKDGSIGKFDHIFADEVQDYSPADLAAVLSAVKDMNNVTIVGDTAQKIDESSTFPGWDKLRKYWSSREKMSHFVRLDLSYRSTIEILKFADALQGERGGSYSKGRHGRAPIWFRCLTESRGIVSAREWLTHATERYPTSITAVVCRDLEQSKYVLTLLRPTFGPIIRHGDDESFSFEGGIVVTHVAQVRGLEFTNLLVWNPSRKDYPADQNHKNLLYLAVSRARENLCLVTWGRESEILPALHSPLVRGYDVAQEELAEQEEEARRRVE